MSQKRNWLCVPPTLDRRALIGGLASASVPGLGFLSGECLGSAKSSAASARGSRSIRTDALSIQLYTARQTLAHDPIGTLHALRRIGYRRVEHAGFAGRRADEFAAALNEAGLECTSGHHEFPQPFDAGAWQKSIDEALTIGQRFIVISSRAPACCFGDVATWAHWQAFAHDLNRAGDQARRHGLSFGFHNHHWDFVQLPGTGIRAYDVVLAETDAGLVHMQLDIFWAWRGAQDPVELFRLYPGRYLQVHVKDMNLEAGFTDLGSGLINFKRIFADAEQAGILEFVVERDDAGARALETARTAYAYMRGLRF